MDTQISEYEQEAIDFLNKTKTKIRFADRCPKLSKDYFGDGQARYVSKVQFVQSGRKFPIFTFGHSLNQGMKRPTAYDILACLIKCEPKSDVWDFAHEYGFDINSKKEYNRVSKIHKAVINEWSMVSSLWNEEELELLREIS